MTLTLRILGVTVRVHFFFVLMALLLGLIQPPLKEDPVSLGLWVLIVFTGVLLHELGHALTGRAFGWQPRIELRGFGGLTEFEANEPGQAAPWRRMLMIVNGPLLGIVLGIGAALLSANLGPVEGSRVDLALRSAVAVNLVWGLANLVPILPLDGGRLMSEVFHLVSPRRGRRVACYVSLVLVSLLAAVGVLGQQPWLVVIALFLGMHCVRMLQEESLGYGTPAPGTAREHAYAALARGDAPRVVQLASRAVTEARSQDEADEALYLLAWGRFLGRDARGAEEALAAISSARPRDYALEGAIALEAGDPDRALELFEKVLPRLNPFVESRVVQAILDTRRYDEARLLFEDALGRGFAPTSLARVQQEACGAEAWEAALGIGERLFQRTQDATVAYNNACCASRLDRFDDAVRWLRRAAERGFARPRSLDEDPDLASLRTRPEWAEVRALFEMQRP